MRLLIRVIAGSIGLVYLLFWLSFMALIIFGITRNPLGLDDLLFSTSGPDGIAGPLFLWLLILFNPITLIIFWMRWVARRSQKLTKEI